MTVYALFLISDITANREGYARYGNGWMDIFNKYEGQLLAVTESPTVLEGDWPFQRNILMSFPSAEALERWYKSPEYQAQAQHRYAASTSKAVVLPSLGDEGPSKLN
jgi:uncharacterized protein (DUF1330 family)